MKNNKYTVEHYLLTENYEVLGGHYFHLGLIAFNKKELKNAYELFLKAFDYMTDAYCPLLHGLSSRINKGCKDALQENLIDNAQYLFLSSIFYYYIENDSYEDLTTLFPNVNEHESNYLLALKYIDLFIETDVEYEIGYFIRGMIYRDLNEIENAIYSFERAISIKETSRSFYYLGECLYKKNRLGIKYIVKSLTINPSSFLAFYFLKSKTSLIGIKTPYYNYNKNFLSSLLNTSLKTIDETQNLFIWFFSNDCVKFKKSDGRIFQHSCAQTLKLFVEALLNNSEHFDNFNFMALIEKNIYLHFNTIENIPLFNQLVIDDDEFYCFEKDNAIIGSNDEIKIWIYNLIQLKKEMDELLIFNDYYVLEELDIAVPDLSYRRSNEQMKELKDEYYEYFVFIWKRNLYKKTFEDIFELIDNLILNGEINIDFCFDTNISPIKQMISHLN